MSKDRGLIEELSPAFDNGTSMGYDILAKNISKKLYISLLQDKEVSFAYEPSNPYDNDAIAITYQGKKLGYVPKGFTRVLKGLIETYQLSAFIERINGTPERPSILIFVEVR